MKLLALFLRKLKPERTLKTIGEILKPVVACEAS